MAVLLREEGFVSFANKSSNGYSSFKTTGKDWPRWRRTG
jgi:hypothetical protein